MSACQHFSFSPLTPFWEALRDRIITDFEVHNLNHKPKLVALTSCAAGSGVSTIAAGLAAALSETGDGNVLLVDMNLNGAAHQFYKGNLALGLDEALQLEKRDGALVQDNLYVVKESSNGDKLPRVMPRRFTHLVPKMRARLRLHHFRHATRQPDQSHPPAGALHGHGLDGGGIRENRPRRRQTRDHLTDREQGQCQRPPKQSPDLRPQAPPPGNVKTKAERLTC